MIAACATSAPPPRTSLPVLAAGDTDAAQGFEAPPVLRAADFVRPELRQGPHHRVADRVPTDGFMRSYRIVSDYGDFEAHGDAMLGARVAEIGALAELEELSAGREFADALRRTLESPFVATWNLVTRPVASITGIPRGAAEALRRSAALARAERGELEGSALGEFLGFEERKRQLAYRLAVDPYSSNPELQRQLNRHAWVSFVGGLPARFVPFTPDADAAAGAPGRARAEQMLRDHSPEDLRRLNRIELAAMGIPTETAEAFIAHPWYSPRQQTALVAQLAALDLVENREVFIAMAARAQSEVDALLYARTAELMRSYHERAGPLARLAPLGSWMLGVTKDERLVAAFALDYAIWSRPARAFLDALVQSVPADGRPARGHEIWVSGSFSPRARAELEQRGIRLRERALEPDRAGSGSGLPARAGQP